MKKYDKILIVIIILLCFAIFFSMTEGIMCFESSGYHFTDSYYTGYYSFTEYGYGEFAISAMAMSLLSLLFSIAALALKKQPKRNLFSIGTLIVNLVALILISIAIEADEYCTYDYYYGTYYFHDDYGAYIAIWALALICICLVFILSPMYLGLSEKERKKQINIEKQNSTPSITLVQGAEELKVLKSLLDEGILTQDEFSLQKAKIFSNMKIKVAIKKSIVGVYDFGSGMTIAFSDSAFAVRSGVGVLITSGKYILDENASKLNLIKSDGTKFKLTVGEDGSLISEKGVHYQKK